MFLYIKDYFSKKIFHILLIVFCGLLTFNSIITLIDLKNYEVVIDLSDGYEAYCDIKEADGQKQLTFEKPKVKAEYKYATLHKTTWVSSQILSKNLSVENFTVEYKIYVGGTKEENVIDSFKIEYDKKTCEPTQKSYALQHLGWTYVYNVVDYDIKFNVLVYLPHIFVIVGSLFFILPSAVMLFKIKKEEE